MVAVRAMRIPLIAALAAMVGLLAAGPATAAPRIEPPQAEITLSPPDEILIKKHGTATATWEFDSNGPNANFTCKFKGHKVGPCRSPITFAGLGRGRYTFTVYASNLKVSPDTSRARDQIRVVKRR